jgi:hypothetical protein
MTSLSLQAGPGGHAAQTQDKGRLTISGSLLVAWGGATDQDKLTCPVVLARGRGTQMQLERCTLQMHPDSTHPLRTALVVAVDYPHVKLADCKLIGPTPGHSEIRAFAACANHHATVTLVSMA